MSTTPFEPYPCSLGTVIAHQADPAAYIIRRADGSVIGIMANGECSPENVEADIAAEPARTLDAAKLAACEAAKIRRAELAAAGFEFGGKLIQTRNQVDIDNINSAAVAATNNPAFTTIWITTDNTGLPLDAAGVLAMQAAMVTRGNTIFAAYIAHRAALNAAEDLTALAAIPPLDV